MGKRKKQFVKEQVTGLLRELGYLTSITMHGLLNPSMNPELKYIKNIEKHYSHKYQYRNYIKQTVKRLEEGGRIISESKGEEIIVKISQKGRKWLRKYEFEHLIIEKQNKWDEVWRIVIFDIPEDQRITRNAVRGWLKRIGFAQLQQSAWVIPWPCQKEFDILCSEYELGNQALLLETKKIAKTGALKRRFEL